MSKNPERRTKLYNALAEKGATDGVEMPEFLDFWNDSSNQDRIPFLFAKAKKAGLTEGKSIDDFNSHFFGDFTEKKNQDGSEYGKESGQVSGDNSGSASVQDVAIDSNATEFQWGAEPSLDGLATGDFSTSVAKSSRQNVREADPQYGKYLDSKELASKPTTSELQDTINIDVGASLTPGDSFRDQEAFDYVANNFQEQTPEVQSALIQYVGGLEYQNKKELLSKPLTDKKKATLAEQSTMLRLKAVSQDLDILKARVEISADGEFRDLVQLSGLRDQAVHNGDVDNAKDLEAQISQYEGSDEFNLLQAHEKYGRLLNEYKGVVGKYPEEFLKRKEIEFEKEKIKVGDDDNVVVAGSKIMRSTGAAIKNRLMDATVKLVGTSKALSDIVQRDALGKDISGYNKSDQVMDNLVDFMDQYKGVTDSQLLTENSEIRGEAVIPAIAGTLADMAVLLFGASKLGGGNAGLAASGTINSYYDYYQAALAKGLDESAAINYGLVSSMVQGGLEIVSPNNAIRGIIKNQSLDALVKRVVDGTNYKSVSKLVLSEIGQENVQELTQNIGELAVNRLVNDDLGVKKFKQDIDAKEVYETFLLTTAATTLMMGAGGVKAVRGQEENAISVLNEKQDEFKQWLSEKRESGDITLEQAQYAWDRVTGKEAAKEVATDQDDAISEEDTAQAVPVKEVEKTEFDLAVEAESTRIKSQVPMPGQVVKVDGVEYNVQEVSEESVLVTDANGNNQTITREQYSNTVNESSNIDAFANLTPEQTDLAKRVATIKSAEQTDTGSGIEVDINTQGVEFNTKESGQQDLSEQANNVVKALSQFGDYKIIAHDNAESLSKTLADKGIDQKATASGIRIGNEIHLVKDQDSETTLFHEAVHPVLDAAIEADTGALDSLYDELTATPEYEASGIKKHEAKYEDATTRKREAITEFIAKVASGEIKNKNIVDKVRSFFENLLGKLGIKPSQVNISTDTGLRSFANSVSKAMRSGTEINAANLKTDPSQGVDFRLSEDSNTLKARQVAQEFAPKIGPGLSKDFLSEQIQKSFGVSEEVATAAIDTVVNLGNKPKKKARPREQQSRPVRFFNDLIQPIQNFHSKYLSSRQGAPKAVAELKDVFNGSLEVETDRVTKRVKEAKRLMKKHKVSEEQVDDYLRGVEGATVPVEMEPVLDDMRNQIDALSQYVLDKGYVNPASAEKIKENMGSYMSRVYKIFVEPNYKPSEKVKVEAARYFAKNKFKKYKATNPSLTDTEVYEKALKEGKSLVEDILKKREQAFSKEGGKRDTGILKEKNENLAPEVKALLGEYTSPFEAYAWTVYKMSNLAYGSKFMSDLQSAGLGKFLFTKGDTATEGARADAGANYKLAGKGSETMWPLNIVNADGHMFDQLGNDPEVKATDFQKRDIYTTKEVYDALMETERNFQASEEKIFKNIERLLFADQKGGWQKMNSWINWLKTVGSIGTHAKNVFGNVPFMMSNGHINPMMLRFDVKSGAKAWKALREDVGAGAKRDPSLTAKENEASISLVEKLKIKGVVGQNLALRIIRDLSGDGMNPVSGIQEVLEDTSNLRKRMWKKTGRVVGKKLDEAYGFEDDYFKVLSFMLEVDQYSKAVFGKKYKDLNESEVAEIDNIAADIVKNTIPNYGKLGKAAKMISRSIIIGNFIAFRAESFRVSYNSIAQGIKEVKSSNKKIKAIGASRLIGAAQVAALRAGIVGAMGQMAGVGFQGLVGAFIDDEEESQRNKDVRKFVYPWLKKHDLFFQSIGNGKAFLYDASGVDPYSATQELMNVALLEDENAWLKVIGEFGGGFLSETILANAMVNVKQGRDNYGNRIWRPNDTTGDKMYNSAMFLGRMAMPGTINSALKIYQSDFKPGVIMGQATGLTPYEIDLNKSFRMEVGKTFTDKDTGMRSKFQYEIYKLKKEKDMSVEDKQAKIDEVNKGMLKELDRLRELYLSAMRLGVEDKRSKRETNALYGLSREHQRYIRTGNGFKGYDMSDLK